MSMKDTIVYVQEKILGDKKDSLGMLTLLLTF